MPEWRFCPALPWSHTHDMAALHDIVPLPEERMLGARCVRSLAELIKLVL